jgi:hypothetical protein
VHLVRAVAHERRREDDAGVGCGLEVDGEQAQRGPAVGGTQLGIGEAQQPRLRAPRGSLDLHAGADAPVDEVAVGEAHVGLERAPQALAQGRHRPGRGNDDPRHGVAREFAQRRLLDGGVRGAARGAQRAERRKEIRAEAVVLHQERRAFLESAEQPDNRHAVAHAIGGLQDDPAGHGFASGLWRQGSRAPSRAPKRRARATAPATPRRVPRRAA